MIFVFFLILADIISLLAATRFVGVLNVIFLVLLMGALGVWILTNQGMMTLRRLQTSSSDLGGINSAVWRGLVMVVAALLFLIPGFFSDVLAILCIFPPTGFLVRRYLQIRMAKGAGSFIFRNFGNAGASSFKVYTNFGGMGSQTSNHSTNMGSGDGSFGPFGPSPFGDNSDWGDASNPPRAVRDVTPVPPDEGEVRHIPANRKPRSE